MEGLLAFEEAWSGDELGFSARELIRMPGTGPGIWADASASEPSSVLVIVWIRSSAGAVPGPEFLLFFLSAMFWFFFAMKDVCEIWVEIVSERVEGWTWGPPVSTWRRERGWSCYLASGSWNTLVCYFKTINKLLRCVERIVHMISVNQDTWMLCWSKSLTPVIHIWVTDRNNSREISQSWLVCVSEKYLLLSSWSGRLIFVHYGYHCLFGTVWSYVSEDDMFEQELKTGVYFQNSRRLRKRQAIRSI